MCSIEWAPIGLWHCSGTYDSHVCLLFFLVMVMLLPTEQQVMGSNPGQGRVRDYTMTIQWCIERFKLRRSALKMIRSGGEEGENLQTE